MATSPCSIAEPRMFGASSLLLILLTTFFATFSTAQLKAQSASERAVAQRFFRQGVAHMEKEQWESARKKFLRSYATYKRASTLLNIAFAESNMNMLVSSADRLRTLLNQARSSADSDAKKDAMRFEEQASERLQDLEKRIPSITVEVDGLLEDDVVQVDGNPVPRSILGVAYPLDPGEHVVTIERSGTSIQEKPITLEEGDSQELKLQAPERVSLSETGKVGTIPEEPEESSGSIASKWWFWTLIGVVVVGAVVGVSVVVAGQNNEPQYFQGNWGAPIPFD